MRHLEDNEWHAPILPMRCEREGEDKEGHGAFTSFWQGARAVSKNGLKNKIIKTKHASNILGILFFSHPKSFKKNQFYSLQKSAISKDAQSNYVAQRGSSAQL